ncbi:MAG: hypothetical protein R6X32_01610 [Chloroflexota bacterium]
MNPQSLLKRLDEIGRSPAQSVHALARPAISLNGVRLVCGGVGATAVYETWARQFSK